MVKTFNISVKSRHFCLIFTHSQKGQNMLNTLLPPDQKKSKNCLLPLPPFSRKSEISCSCPLPPWWLMSYVSCPQHICPTKCKKNPHSYNMKSKKVMFMMVILIFIFILILILYGKTSTKKSRRWYRQKYLQKKKNVLDRGILKVKSLDFQKQKLSSLWSSSSSSSS